MTKLTKTITKNTIKTIDYSFFKSTNASVTLHDVTPVVKEVRLVNYVNSLIYLYIYIYIYIHRVP